METKKEQIAARVDRETMKLLRELKVLRGTVINWMIEKAIEEYVEREFKSLKEPPSTKR